MKKRLIAATTCLLLLTVAVAEEAAAPEPSNFPHMLRGYCFAGSKIRDKKALGGFATSNNFPRKLDAAVGEPRDDVYLLALPDAEARFAGKYRGMRVLLVNGTRKRQAFPASDSRIDIVQEAKDANGEWKPIEYLPSSWCGNSYHTVFLGPREYWSFDAPRYKGSFPTTLRFTLTLGKKTLHSNEFPGSINPEQFTVKEGHTPQNIMDPYTE